MREQFVSELRCPACGSEHSFTLCGEERDGREWREGELGCRVCAQRFSVHRGVPELLYDPPEHIVVEAAGLERFAEVMATNGWNREMVLRLPDVEHGYWYVQSRSMHQLLTTIPVQAGQSILDVGSNTCWAANHFAERGMRAIALDISTAELQGLYTADYFLQEGRVFFERVLGSMDSIPLASSSVDYVYCCEVLHHNDLEGLRRTFREIFRVLRPGGRLLMVNETLKTLRDREGVDVVGVEQFHGYEHAHWALTYRWEAIRAGFLTEVMEPHYRSFFGDASFTPRAGAGPLARTFGRAAFRLRRFGLVRRLYLAWLNHVWGGVSMNMIATKPSRCVGRHEGIGTGERMLRSLLARVVRIADTLRGKGPERLPRTPEQAQRTLTGDRR